MLLFMPSQKLTLTNTHDFFEQVNVYNNKTRVLTCFDLNHVEIYSFILSVIIILFCHWKNKL